MGEGGHIEYQLPTCTCQHSAPLRKTSHSPLPSCSPAAHRLLFEEVAARLYHLLLPLDAAPGVSGAVQAQGGQVGELGELGELGGVGGVVAVGSGCGGGPFCLLAHPRDSLSPLLKGGASATSSSTCRGMASQAGGQGPGRQPQAGRWAAVFTLQRAAHLSTGTALSFSSACTSFSASEGPGMLPWGSR